MRCRIIIRLPNMNFVIEGGKKLHGSISVSGSKNAATPILAATLLTSRRCVIRNVPKIGDVLTMLALLKSMGSRQEWLDLHTVSVINDDVHPERLDQKLVAKIRSSILVVAPLLARYGRVSFVTPGGCLIGSRPIETHLEAFRDLGATVEFDPSSGMYTLSISKFRAREIVLREFSVTATENIIMMGWREPLTVRLAATEPHVADLGNFLAALGARAEGVGTHTVSIAPPEQGDAGREISYTIINDDVEAGTFAVLAAATKSRMAVKGVVHDHLEAALRKLREMGVVFSIEGDTLTVNGPASNLKAAKIETRMHPGLPSDLQAPFGVLATQAQGTSLLFDTLYDGRLRYIDALQKMGADATVLDPHRALIKGPSVLHGTSVPSLDLRAGATLIIAALIAKGESTIAGAEEIDRGYERIDERLRELGANIRREN